MEINKEQVILAIRGIDDFEMRRAIFDVATGSSSKVITVGAT